MIDDWKTIKEQLLLTHIQPNDVTKYAQYENLKHRVSLWFVLHFMLQYRLPHRVQLYVPRYPHTEQKCRAGNFDGPAAAVR